MTLISIRIVRLLAIGAVLLAVLSIGADGVSKYNEGVAEHQQELMRQAKGEPSFGFYGDYGDHRPWKRLLLVPLTLLGWFAFRRSITYKLAAIVYGMSTLVFAHWAWMVINAIVIDWNLYSDRSLLDLLSLAANPFDYLLFAVVLALFIFILSSFTRSLFGQSPKASFP